MSEKEFLQHFAEQFDDNVLNLLSLQTQFRDLDGWSSLIALSIMAMCNEEYDVLLTASEMESANKIEDIYNIVKLKTNV